MTDLEKYYKLALNIVNLDSNLLFMTCQAGRIIEFEVPCTCNVLGRYYLTYSVKNKEIEITKSNGSASCSPYDPEDINEVIDVIKDEFSNFFTKQLLKGIE